MLPKKIRNILKEIYCGFPREIGTPARYTISSFEELERNIEKYNERKKVFTSLYNYTRELNPALVIVDKIFFDFDAKDGNPFIEMKKVFNYLFIEKLKFFVVFSGGGFHIYIFTRNNTELLNPKKALEGAHKKIISLVEENTKEKLLFDKTVIGDITQLVRIPSTRNRRRDSWCCFINHRDIEIGFEHIKAMAKENRFGHFQIFGNRYFDVKPFDAKADKPLELEFVFAGEEGEKINPKETVKKAKLCIQHLVKNTEGNNEDRFVIISYFMSEGFSIIQVKKILGEFLPADKFRHCVKENQVERIFRKIMLTPECNKLKNMGHCIKECKRGDGKQ